MGNKCDVADKREVATQEGQELADFYGMSFLETSAKDTINISEAFFTMAKGTLEKLTRGQEVQVDDANKIAEGNLKKRKASKGKCC